MDPVPVPVPSRDVSLTAIHHYVRAWHPGIPLQSTGKATNRNRHDLVGNRIVSAVWFYVDDLFIGSFLIRQPISGNNLGSLSKSAWEALICTGLGIGLLTLFREWINKPAGRFMSVITRAQFGAYIFHLLVLLGVQAGLANLPLSALVKFVIATIFGAGLSFGISHLLLKIPSLRKVI